MALRVPTVQGPTVEDRPLNTPFQRSSVSPGMLQNQQLEQTGRVLQEVGAQLQEREDADTLMRAETEIKSKYLEWEGEAKQRKGQNAWGVAKEAGEFWDKEADRIGGAITSPRAKQLFDREVQKNRGMSVGTFAGHEAAQRRASLDESAQASIVSSINLAAANPGNPELLAATKGDILKRTQMLAKVNGWAPEVVEVKQAEYLTNFHKQVIQGLVTKDPSIAATYFEANKGEIEGSQHAEVGAFAAKATATRLGETAADAVWQEVGPKNDREPVQIDRLIETVRKRTDIGDEAKKVSIAALKERAAAFKDGRRERDEQLEASVNQAILNGASGAQIRAMPQFLQLSPEAGRKLSDFMENRALRAEQVAASRASRAASAEARADSAESRAERQRGRAGMAAYLTYSDPTTLAGMTDAQVINLLPTLGGEHTKHLMERKRELAKPGKAAEAKMDEDDFNHVARQMKLPVDKASKTEDEKAMLGEVKFRVEQMISAAQANRKVPVTRDEKLQMMRQELARTVTVGGFFSDRQVPVVALTPGEVDKVVIPPADRQELTTAMRTMYERTQSPAYAPTAENLKRFYLLNKSPAAGYVLPRN